MRTAKVSILAAILVAVACGGGAVNPNEVQNGSCSANLTGALSGSNITCFAAAGTDGNGDGNGAVSFSFTGTSGFTVVAGVKAIGQPTTKTYASTDANAQGACEVLQTATNQAWIASTGDSSTPNLGSYSLAISGLGNEISNPDGGPGNVFLAVHGSLNCVIPALVATGASGTINLSANF